MLTFAISSAACWKPGADASIYEKFPVALHVITDEVPPLPQHKLPTKRRLSSWCKAMLVCAEDCVLPQACKQASPRVQGYEAPVGGADDVGLGMTASPSGCGAVPHSLSLSKGGDRDVSSASADEKHRGEDSEDPLRGQEVRKLSEPLVPTIFASKHGERAREIGMLIDYTRGEGVSQGGFSLSVHNVAASLFSISQENRQPYSAIAAGEETFEAGLLEAVMHLEKYERVLLVVGDEQAPNELPDELTLPQVHALLLKRGNDFAIESGGGASALSANDFFLFAGSSEKELRGATIKVSVC